MGIRGHHNTPVLRELLCRKCCATWHYEGETYLTHCPYCGAAKEARDRRGKYPAPRDRSEGPGKWRAVPGNQQRYSAAVRDRLRRRVFFRVSGSIVPRCARCGCDDVRLLELNHRNGGGAKELRAIGSQRKLQYAIATGKRPVDDLEVLCKPCNAIHALELKYGALPMRIVWEGQASDGSRVEGGISP